MGTIPASEFLLPSPLPRELAYFKGQREHGCESGYDHFQTLAVFTKTVRLSGVRKALGAGHWELTRSAAASEYVWKEDTAVADSRY